MFHRLDTPIKRVTELQNRRVAIGQPGSGTHAVATALLNVNHIDSSGAELVELNTTQSVNALRSGQIDAVFAVASPRAPFIEELLHAPEIALMSFQRAKAYSRTFPFLSSVVLPQGVVSFVNNIPPNDVELLAPTANLVAGENLHPALISLLLRAAAEIHGNGGIFEAFEQFPSSASA